MGVLEGKVAVVTGAGRGLGRAHALALAREGARVVVNDFGVSADGSGRDESAGRGVVDEIKAFGGEAIAHFGDVADWNDSKGMIEAAVKAFGDFNILVSNAGFLRDKMFFSMNEADFDAVIRRAAFNDGQFAQGRQTSNAANCDIAQPGSFLVDCIKRELFQVP